MKGKVTADQTQLLAEAVMDRQGWEVKVFHCFLHSFCKHLLSAAVRVRRMNSGNFVQCTAGLCLCINIPKTSTRKRGLPNIYYLWLKKFHRCFNILSQWFLILSTRRALLLISYLKPALFQNELLVTNSPCSLFLTRHMNCHEFTGKDLLKLFHLGDACFNLDVAENDCVPTSTENMN